MEKTLEKGRLPQMDSVEELARFWDTHDLTDFEADLEEARQPVFVRAKGKVLTISLKASEAQRLKRIARSSGVKDTTLLRQWIVEKLDDCSLFERRQNRYEDSTVKKTKFSSTLKKRMHRKSAIKK